VGEIEGVLSAPVAVLPDLGHSAAELRYRLVGRAEAGRYVFVVFTVRHRDGKDYIRPISARYMHRREVTNYEKEKDSDV
jgi:uncharacterized DUF497 family protein